MLLCLQMIKVYLQEIQWNKKSFDAQQTSLQHKGKTIYTFIQACSDSSPWSPPRKLLKVIIEVPL